MKRIIKILMLIIASVLFLTTIVQATTTVSYTYKWKKYSYIETKEVELVRIDYTSSRPQYIRDCYRSYNVDDTGNISLNGYVGSVRVSNSNDKEVYYAMEGELFCMYVIHKGGKELGNTLPWRARYVYEKKAKVYINVEKDYLYNVSSSYSNRYPHDDLHSDGYYYKYIGRYENKTHRPDLSVNNPTQINSYFNKDTLNTFTFTGSISDDIRGNNLYLKLKIGDREIPLSSENNILSNKNYYYENEIKFINSFSEIEGIPVTTTINGKNISYIIKNIYNISLSSGQIGTKNILYIKDIQDGAYPLSTVLTDKNSDRSESTLIFKDGSTSIKIDSSPPIVNVPIGTAISDTQINISVNATDEGIGLITEPYLYNKDGIDIETWTSNAIYQDTGLIPNTKYVYKYKAKDKLGHISDYSPAVVKYTLALNPESINTLTKANTSITFKVNNQVQGEAPETKLDLKLKGAGEIGDVVSYSDWTTDTERIITGLTADTEYELWVTTRNCNKIENAKYKAIETVKTNVPSCLVNTTVNNQSISEVEGYKEINISGIVKDEDIGDILKINYRIDGNSGDAGQQIGEDIIANEENQDFNNSIDLSLLTEGTHKLSLWVEDDKGSRSLEEVREFLVDKTAPNISLSNPPAGFNSVDFTTDVLTDDISKIKTIKITYDDNEIYNNTFNKPLNETETVKDIEINSENDLEVIKKLQITAIDAVGNIANKTYDYQFDKKTPQLKNSSYSQIDKKGTLEFTDEGSGLNTLKYYYSNQENITDFDLEYTSVTVKDTKALVGNIQTVETIENIENNKYIHVKVTDQLDNTETFVIDIEPPTITGIYTYKGMLYVLGTDNKQLHSIPYGFEFLEPVEIDEPLSGLDESGFNLEVNAGMTIPVGTKLYKKENNIKITVPLKIEVMLKDASLNISKQLIDINNNNEVIYGHVTEEIQKQIDDELARLRPKHKDKDENITIIDDELDEDKVKDIEETLKNTDIAVEETEINSGTGSLKIDISDILSKKYSGDINYRLDVIQKDKMRLVYTLIIDNPEIVEIPKLSDSTTYIIRISIIEDEKELAFKEIEKMTLDRTAPIIEMITFKDNILKVKAEDNKALHEKAYKFKTIDEQTNNYEIDIINNDMSLKSLIVSNDISGLDINNNWSFDNWVAENKVEASNSTKMKISVRDKEGNYTETEITTSEGDIQQLINKEKPLKIDVNSEVSLDDLLEKIIAEINTKFNNNYSPEDFLIDINSDIGSIYKGKFKATGTGSVILNLTNKITGEKIQYLLKIDNPNSFERRIIVQVGSKTDITKVFEPILYKTFNTLENIKFEEKNDLISIKNDIVTAYEEGIGVITASKNNKEITLYVVIGERISSVYNNIETTKDNIGYTILKDKEEDITKYMKIFSKEGYQALKKYIVIETDNKDLLEINNTTIKGIKKGVATIRIIDLINNIQHIETLEIVELEDNILKEYEDIQNHWAKEAIEKATKQGILKGYKDNKYNPEKNITIKEFLVVMNRIKIKKETNGERIITKINLNKNDWSYYNIKNATMNMTQYEIDYVFDYTTDYNRAITREEAAYIIAKIYKKELTTLEESKSFNDIEKVTVEGILKEYEDKTIRPKDITRGEMANIIIRLLEY